MTDVDSASQTPSHNPDTHRRRLRLRNVVADWWWLAVLLGIVLLAGGGWLLFGTVVAPEPTTQTTTLGSIEYTGTFEHAATVQTDNELFPVGTELENQPVYYTRLSPVANGSYVLTYDTTGLEDQSATVTVTRVIRAVDEEAVLWEQTDQLASEHTTASDGTVTAAFTLDVPAVERELETIQESLGSTAGETEVLIETTVVLEGGVGEQTTTVETTHTATVGVGGDTYTVEPEAPIEDTATVTRTESVSPEPRPIELLGISGLLLGGIGLIVVATLARVRGHLALTDEEQAWLTYQSDRAEFEEWIRTIDQPPAATREHRGTAASLADLADFAIDTDNAVIYDPTTATYTVATGDTQYVYEPPAQPTPMSWWSILGLAGVGSPTDTNAAPAEEPAEESAEMDAELIAPETEADDESSEGQR